MTESLTDYLINMWQNWMNQKLIAWLIDSITEDEKELNGVKLFDLPIDSQVDWT